MLVVGGLVALAWGIVQSGPDGTGLPDAIPEDLAVHVEAPGSARATLEAGTYWVVATGTGIVSASVDGPEPVLAGSDLVLPAITVVDADGEPRPVDPSPPSLLVQGPEGGLDAQGVAVVDVPVAGEHVLTVGEASAPVEGVGLVSIAPSEEGTGASTTFLATFGGTAAIVLGVLLVVLRLR